jgi:transcriptional regulator with XRE-family HTH domain
MKNFGEYLKDLREAKELTVEELAEKLGVKKDIILILESGKRINLILAKKILTKANEILESKEDLFNLYLENFQDNFPENKYKKSIFVGIDILFLILIFTLIFYIGISFKGYLEPPKATILQDDELVFSPYYVFDFKVEPKDSVVFINGVKIYPDTLGNVKKEVYLKEGINEFEIEVVNKLDRKIKIKKKIIYNK